MQEQGEVNKMTDEFKVIPGCEKYEVSRDGRVRRIKDCITPTIKITKSGFHYFNFKLGKSNRYLRIHRAVLSTFRPSKFPDDRIIHIDKNPLNDHVDNLIWASEISKSNEEFKIIPEYPQYEITKTGIVRDRVTNRLVKPRIDDKGYWIVKVKTDRSKYAIYRYIHRLLMLAWVPNPNNYEQINHIDGNKSNYSLTNLEWCTQSMNQRHAYDTGLNHGLVGESNPRAKLTESEVREIRKLRQDRVPTKEIAKMFPIGDMAVQAIIYNKTWTHVV